MNIHITIKRPLLSPENRSTNLKSLQQALESLEEEMNLAVENLKTLPGKLHPSQKISGENLVRYLVLRSHDIRPLQDQLHLIGLSSLASSESHVLSQIHAILRMTGKNIDEINLSDCDYFTCNKLIRQRAKNLFGFKKDKAIPYIMVTFDTRFADDFQLVKKLLETGMNVARINCAHDNEEIWLRMVKLIRQASEQTNIPCNIYMDLAGPKIRGRILGKGREQGKINLSAGEEVILTNRYAEYDPLKAVIGVSPSKIIEQLKIGDHVLFDDGLIEARVIHSNSGAATVKIIRVPGKNSSLKDNKGINLPGKNLDLPALTDDDYSVLPFICEHADLVGYSFVNHPDDIAALQKILNVQKRKPFIILKIETAQAVKNFPALLIQGMNDRFFGVMIARGDLASEAGFERLSEIQEELLWISEAAHVPIIWATQVLESLNKSGIPTRAEITDASHSSMAECVMINKGDYIIDVIEVLKDILQRSSRHHVKKRYALGPMQIAINFFK